LTWEIVMAVEPVAAAAPPHPYSHPLIDWGAAIAGTVVAVAIGFTLLILGVAIGATAMNPWQGTSEQAPAWTIAGGLWVIFSNLVALQVGAFVAVRAARWPDHHSGMLQGIVVWALAFTLAAGVLGFGVSGVLAGADAMTIEESASRAVDAAQAATGEATNAPETLNPGQVDAVQNATALTAWWAFAAMVLGAVGAVAGGKLGSAHPDWHARERLPRPITMADKV
jgi:hypothetical protein